VHVPSLIEAALTTRHNSMIYPLAESIDSSAPQTQEQSVGPNTKSELMKS